LKGQSKPESVSIRIREDAFVVVAEIARKHGIKNVDAVDALVYAWTNYVKDVNHEAIVWASKK